MVICEGGFEAWKKAGEKVDIIIEVEPDELLMDMQFDNNLVVLDVRKENEFAEGHLPGAMNIPLSEMIDPATMANIEDGHNLYVHCGGGYRSVIACSLLKRRAYIIFAILPVDGIRSRNRRKWRS